MGRDLSNRHVPSFAISLPTTGGYKLKLLAAQKLRTPTHRCTGNARYERYKAATTLEEYYALGGSRADAKFDMQRGYIRVKNKTPKPAQTAGSLDKGGANGEKARRCLSAKETCLKYFETQNF